MHRVLNRLVRAYLRRSPITEGKSALLRATRARIRPADSEQLSETKWGFSLRLNLDNPEQERIYFYGEHDERYEIACLRRLIAPGMVCWDIGANIGFYTCLLAKLVGETGAVVAFEPATATRAMLEDNVRLNHFANVQIQPLALGAEDGEARLYFGEARLAEGTASMHQSAGKRRSEPIAVARLDTLAPGLRAPDLVKIDVEGAQEAVWTGGREFFAATPALVMAELRETTDAVALRRLQAMIVDRGFRFFEMHKGARVREIEDLSRSRKRNFLLAKPQTDALRRLSALSV